MNIALIIAGGSGKRMGQDIPKQFIQINGKPVIIYTLEAFQDSPNIDAIEVVCIQGWEEILEGYVKQYKISKLKWVVNGGKTVQESIRNGVFNLKDKCDDDDTIIIHDSIRPLIDQDVISDVLVKCSKYGNAISSLPYYEQIFYKEDELCTKKYIQRDKIRRLQTPQAYKMNKLYSAYTKAFEMNIGTAQTSYTNTMMVDLGETLYFAAGSEKNIKLTTADDLDIFKALLLMQNKFQEAD